MESEKLLADIEEMEREIQRILDSLCRIAMGEGGGNKDDLDLRLGHYLTQLYERLHGAMNGVLPLAEQAKILRQRWMKLQTKGITSARLVVTDDVEFMECPASAALETAAATLRDAIALREAEHQRERAVRDEERAAEAARRQRDIEHEITMRHLEEQREIQRREQDHRRDIERRAQEEEREKARRAEDEARDERRRAEDRRGQRWVTIVSASVAVIASLASLAGIGFANADKWAGPRPEPASAVVLEGRIAMGDGSPLPVVSVECVPQIEGVAVAAAGPSYTVTVLPSAPRGLRLFCSAVAAGLAADPVLVVGPTSTTPDGGSAPTLTLTTPPPAGALPPAP